jgi:hypothetical protein
VVASLVFVVLGENDRLRVLAGVGLVDGRRHDVVLAAAEEEQGRAVVVRVGDAGLASTRKRVLPNPLPSTHARHPALARPRRRRRD